MASVTSSLAEIIRLIPGYDPYATAGDSWFDEDAAQRPIDFCEQYLTHVEGEKARQPFILELWQQAIFANLFGWLRKDRKGRVVRRYRESLIYVPRKNGKTPFAAALGLFVLFCDEEYGQQNYVAADTRETAGKLFRHAKGMVENEASLRSGSRIYGGHAEAGQSRSIVRETRNSFFRVISADGGVQHGGNTHLALVDELHTQPDRELVDTLITSTASDNRPNPLIAYLTTSDFQRESICNEKHDYACKVRDGIIEDPAFLPVIYEATDKDDWTSPETWAKANPNLGVSVSEEYLERECARARETPAYENTFKRLHLNMKTEQDVRWLNMELWDACAGPIATIAGKRVALAIDFGWRDDYAALVASWMEGNEVHVKPWFWLPEDGRRDKRLFPVATFIAENLVTITPGNSTDIEAIYKQVDEIAAVAEVIAVALDPNNARKQAQDLMEKGYEVVEFGQSKAKYNEPCRFLEALLRERRLRHGGHKVLRWMASNAACEEDGQGNIMPKKKKSSEKIDGIAAGCMSLGILMGDEGGEYWNPADGVFL